MQMALDGHLGYLEMFMDAVIGGERPKLTSEELPDSRAFEQLISECWDHDPSKRPLMSDVVSRIDDIILIDLRLLPAFVQQFWRTTMAPNVARHSIRWTLFAQHLLSELFPTASSERLLADLQENALAIGLGTSAGSGGNLLHNSSHEKPWRTPAVINYWHPILFENGAARIHAVENMEQLKFLIRSLRLTLLPNGDSDSIVTFPRFYQLFSTFSEPGTTSMQEIMSSFATLVHSGFFFGDITSSQFGSLLESAQVGTVIIRTSSSSAQDLWLTTTITLHAGYHTHARIFHFPSEPYTLTCDNTLYSANSITELIKNAFPNRVQPPGSIRTKYDMDVAAPRSGGYQHHAPNAAASSRMHVDS